MRLIITKPNKGRVNITVDDKRGLSGFKDQVHGVRVEEVEEVASELVGRWRRKRQAVYNARKAKLD